MIIPDLKELLAYKNQLVVQAFCKQHRQFSVKQAEDYFADLLGWMWLTVYRKNRHKATWLFGPLLILDDMWHCFILHTRDYQTFCQRFFGDFFHHDPEENGKEHQLEAEELSDFLNDAFTHLEEKWVERHFSSLLADGT